MKTYLFAGACAASMLAAMAGSAFAQAAAPEDGAVAEIVVTAQNRAQAVQDVPIRMDVINAEQLAQAGFSDANDLAKIAPVAMVQQDQGTVQVTVRGVGNTAGGSTDNSVVTNIDGEYINNPAALGVSLFDLERVEVLRGPQGTLYGRNATGGAVNFIMRRPGDRLGMNASVSYGNYNAIRADAGVDVPLADNIGLRFAGFFEDRDGYVKHPALARGEYYGFDFPGYAATRSDDNRAFGGRASFQARDIGKLSVYAAAEYSEREFSPQAFAAVDTHLPGFTPGPNCAGPGWARTAPAIPGQTLCIPSTTNYLKDFNRAEYAAPANGVGRQFWNTYAVRGRLDYEFGPAATLSYIGGYRFFERDPRTRGSLPVVYGNTTLVDKTGTQSHELRLAGEVGDGIIYQVGGFYFREDSTGLGGFYLGDVTPGSQNFGFYIDTNLRDSLNVSKSLFGQVEVPLTSTITAVGGLRYTDNLNKGYWRDKDGFWVGPETRTPATDTFTPPQFLESKQDKVTWLAGLNWEPDPDTLVYGKVSSGFKAGGFDGVGTFGPETNTAYEAGVKKNIGRHIWNASAFYYDYKGLQVDVLLSSAEGGRVFNAGKAVVWGLETDWSFEITRDTHFTGSINYLNSELKELFALYNVYCVPLEEGGQGNCVTPTGDDYTAIGDLDPNTAGIQSPNYAGNRPGYAPRWIVTFGLDHTFDLGSNGTLTARANTTFKSKYFTNFLNYNDAAQKAFTQTDLTLDYEARSGWGVQAFVRNIENKRTLTQAYFLAAGPDDIWNYQFGTPRTYGVRVKYDF